MAVLEALVALPRHEAARRAGGARRSRRCSWSRRSRRRGRAHRRLSDTAAIVIAHQKQAQDRLDAKLRECEKAKASTGQAVLLIDREARHGNEAQVATYTSAAEGLANRVLTLEVEVRELDDALLQASAAAGDAKAAVVRNAKELEQQLDDRERLLSVLDRAKMQEALNQAHEQLSMLPGADVPTYAQVERKILGRQAVAEAKGELNAAQFTAGVDPAMLEIEAAQRSAEAQAFLAQMRTQLGLVAPDDGTSTPPRMIER